MCNTTMPWKLERSEEEQHCNDLLRALLGAQSIERAGCDRLTRANADARVVRVCSRDPKPNASLSIKN